MKKIFLFAIALSVAFFSSCTKLDEGVYDKYDADRFYATPEGANAALANIYAEMTGDFGGKGIAGGDRGWYDLNESCTDEMMIPRRSDGAWDDNGIWRQMYLHTWTPAHEFMSGNWNWLYRSVFKANLAVELLTKANAAPELVAEAKVLRAYFYYMLMDAYGSVPFYTDNSLTVDKIPQASRTTVYNFVASELAANVPLLSSTIGGTHYNRFNKWAGYALLTKVYINAQVYTGTARWTEASAAADMIINSGSFSLVPAADYFSGLFGVRCDDREVLLGIFLKLGTNGRNIIGIRTLQGAHGNALFGISTWNGATMHRNLYDKYDAADMRRSQWLVGSQPGGVNYSLAISDLNNAGVSEGTRSAKFSPVEPRDGGGGSNHFPVYRYADVLLMKAEAQFRLGNAAVAKGLVDQIRVRAGLAPLVANPTADDIYDERGRELCWEGHRRQDMIRFDKFTLAHDFKPATDNKYKLFPIPVTALATNPSLVQNPGY